MNLFHRQISSLIFFHWVAMAFVTLAGLAMVLDWVSAPWANWFLLMWMAMFFDLSRDSFRRLPGKWVRTEENAKPRRRPWWFVILKRLSIAAIVFGLFYLIVMWDQLEFARQTERFIVLNRLIIAGVWTALVAGWMTRHFFYFRNVPESDVLLFMERTNRYELPVRPKYVGTIEDHVLRERPEVPLVREKPVFKKPLPPEKAVPLSPDGGR